MARVALIETYPYEAVLGGDAVYLDRIRTFLISRGHDVDSYVTNVTRGRSNPTLRLRTQADANHNWRVRNAVRLGEGRYCSLDLRLIGKALRRMPGRRAAPDHGIEPAELAWVVKGLRATRPDLVILAYGACELAPTVCGADIKVLALKGFFSDRRIRLGEKLPTPFVSGDLLAALGHATRVGFNNQYDLDLYSQLSGRNNGMLVGMGLRFQTQPPPHGVPTLVFVGARTMPNVESLEWFLAQVWPRIRAAVPNAELRVAGSVGSAFADHRCAGVTFLGFVAQLDDEYQRAAAAIAPLVSGSSGVKTKIAEALSFGRPVVTTSLGIDPGNPDQYGSAVSLADDPEAFAAAAVRLLSDANYRGDRLRDAARQFERSFGEESAYQDLVELLEPAESDLRIATK